MRTGTIATLLVSGLFAFAQETAYINCRSNKQIKVYPVTGLIAPTVACGEQITVDGPDETGLWFRIRTKNNTQGYVARAFVSKAPPGQSAAPLPESISQDNPKLFGLGSVVLPPRPRSGAVSAQVSSPAMTSSSPETARKSLDASTPVSSTENRSDIATPPVPERMESQKPVQAARQRQSYSSVAPIPGALDEVTLGLAYRRRILAAHAKIEGTVANEYAGRVFDSLLSTSIGSAGPPLPFEVTLVEDSVPNAYATPAGKVYVTRGLFPVLAKEPGVWAAVLGHEIGHAVAQHHYRKYLRNFQRQRLIRYYQALAAQGNASANWALVGVLVGGGLINLKLSRDEEHEADRLALMMMVEAGYNPDFAITLQQRMVRMFGDQSKAGAFFSDHPRWATREQRTVRVYSEALAAFESRWPDARLSPGGAPPPVATLGNLSASQDNARKEAVIRVPLNVRNAKDAPILVTARFVRNRQEVPAALDEYRSERGTLIAAISLTPTSGNHTSEAVIHIPTTAVGVKERKLKALVSVIVGGQEIAAQSLDVSFPKP